VRPNPKSVQVRVELMIGDNDEQPSCDIDPFLAAAMKHHFHVVHCRSNVDKVNVKK
jgi:hypothetical protein